MGRCSYRWIFEIVADKSHGVGGIFFHEPVAGVGDHGFAHVGGYVAHDCRLHGAEGLRSTDGEDRHGKFCALEGLVVFYVLREGFEVFEAGMHGSGFGVLRSVELACEFVGLSGSGAEIVPNAVEVDALAALDEAVFVGAPKGEVP